MRSCARAQLHHLSRTYLRVAPPQPHVALPCIPRGAARPSPPAAAQRPPQRAPPSRSAPPSAMRHRHLTFSPSPRPPPPPPAPLHARLLSFKPPRRPAPPTPHAPARPRRVSTSTPRRPPLSDPAAAAASHPPRPRRAVPLFAHPCPPAHTTLLRATVIFADYLGDLCVFDLLHDVRLLDLSARPVAALLTLLGVLLGTQAAHLLTRLFTLIDTYASNSLRFKLSPTLNTPSASQHCALPRAPHPHAVQKPCAPIPPPDIFCRLYHSCSVVTIPLTLLSCWSCEHSGLSVIFVESVFISTLSLFALSPLLTLSPCLFSASIPPLAPITALSDAFLLFLVRFIAR